MTNGSARTNVCREKRHTISVVISFPDLSILTQSLRMIESFRRGSSLKDLYRIASKESRRANMAKSRASR